MKKTVRTRGLVLRTTAYSDSSQIVSVFTKDQGIVSLLARGSMRLARRSSSFPAPFDLGGWYDVVYRERQGDLFLALEGRLVEGFRHLRRRLPIYVDTCLALEVVRRSYAPGVPHPRFLRGALSYFKLLEGCGSDLARVVLRIHFFSQMLTDQGLAPQWNQCLECHGPVGEDARLSMPHGVRCAECSAGRGRPATIEVLRYLDAEGQAPWGEVSTLSPPSKVAFGAWALTSELLVHYLERPPRSLRYLAEGGLLGCNPSVMSMSRRLS